MKFITALFINSFFTILFICTATVAMAQEKPYLRSSEPVKPKKGVAKKDTVKKDTLKTDSASVKLTASGLTTPVKYSASDSTTFLNKRKVAYLYGNARVSYEDFELSAAFIRLDQEHNTIFARGIIDPRTSRYTGWPIFKQGAEPPVKVDSMTYNYVTKKLSTTNVSSAVEGGFLQAEVSKKNQYDEVSFKNGKYSTCDLPNPHFYIAISKGIAFEKQIVTGPAYLVIEGVTFPAIIPFGFFPKTSKQQSGVLFPTFGEDGVRGFYMRDLGYYIGLNEYWDAEVRGSIYSKGSYEGSLNARYDKNYKYSGNLVFRYASTRLGIEGTPEYKPNKDFNIQWTHSQRNEANPGTTFSASVNAGTSSYNSNTAAGGTYDISQITRNTLASRISYGKTFGNGLFNFTTGLSHSQDIQTKQISLTLPEYSLTMNSFNPFDSKNRTGDQQWFQRITIGYSSSGSNSITTREDQLFKKSSINKFTNGITHSFTSSFSQTVLKYLQFSANVPYTERWSFKTITKHYLPAKDSIVADTIGGFARSGDYSFGGNFSTKIFGQLNFKKGRLLAIRHTMTPTIGFSYHPDFGADRYGYYKKVQSDPTGLNFERYSIFTDGGPSAGKSGSINFSLDNTLEAKRRLKGDTATATEKVPLIQGLSIAGTYNLAVNEYRLSDISFNGRTAFFKQKLGINFSGDLSPYALSDAGLRINEYALKHGTLARLTSIGLSTDFSFNSQAAKSRGNAITQGNQNRANLTPDQADALNRITRDPNAFVDFNIPWNINMSYSFNYTKPLLKSNITNTLNFSGDLSVTPKWKVTYNSGYDFEQKKISFTNFSIYRDLHCWDLNFTWVPFGPYRSYSVDLRVRASVLQDLKLSRRRDYYTNF